MCSLNLRTREFAPVVSLNRERFGHASLAIGSNLFVISSKSFVCDPIKNTEPVEMLQTDDPGGCWQILDFSDVHLSSVKLVSALNANEMLIIGTNMQTHICNVCGHGSRNVTKRWTYNVKSR